MDNSKNINYSQYEFGIKSEVEMLKLLQNDFQDFKFDFYENRRRYAEFDFEGFSSNGRILIELKTRKCKFDDFKTVIISQKKYMSSIEAIKKDLGVQIYHFFKYSDGKIMFIKFDMNWIINYNLKPINGQNYFYIPNDKFKSYDEFFKEFEIK